MKKISFNLKIFGLIMVIVASISIFGGCGETTSQVYVDGIEISKKNLYLAEGQTSVISAQVYPFNANNQNYSFESSDSTIVTCDDGFVVAKKAGDAVIYVYSEEGGYKDSCNVLVTKASDNLEINNYNNLNMPPKELEPIYETNNASAQTSAKPAIKGKGSASFISKLKNLAVQKTSEEVAEDIEAGKKVLSQFKQELNNSLLDLESEKNVISNLATETGDTLFDAFNNLHLSMLDEMQKVKQSMINSLDNINQKIDDGEYTVESKDINGVTFVVMKGTNKMEPTDAQQEI